MRRQKRRYGDIAYCHTTINLWSKVRFSKRRCVTHLNEHENNSRQKSKINHYKAIAANQNINRNRKMSKPKHVSIPARVRTIFRESAEAAPKAYLSILLFTVIGLVISSLNYVVTGGEEFANAYSVLTVLVGQISVFYITQTSVIHGTPPAIRQMVKKKSFWIYALGVVLLSATFFLTFKLSLSSVVNGWGGFMNLFGIKPEAYGFPDIEKIAITTSFFLTIFFARKLAFVLPEIVAGKSLNFVTSWKLMKTGNIPFWITLIFVMSPLVALAVGYTYVRTPYLITQIVTQILTYFLMTMHAIVFSATAAVFWKEVVGDNKAAIA